jgi:NOL1/NOP2/sun family putative RNA methylase
MERAVDGADKDGLAASLERYGALIEDPAAFLAAATTPLPLTLWVNPLKAQTDVLLRDWGDRGVIPQPIAWMPGAWRCDGLVQPGNTLPYAAGWYYVQEEIAMAAVAALDPQPGERILDLCAAPGGKTLQIAAQVGATGLVVANDFDAGRRVSLSSHIQRLGFTNILTTGYDGRQPVFPPGYFDRVLVDAPCSGEGTLRRRLRWSENGYRASSRPWRAHYSQRIGRVQRQLLDQALRAVKPGGTVVYSTCTFAPEENEAVLDGTLGDRADCVPWRLPLRHQPGVTAWEGHRWRSDLVHGQRYWPHFNDTGGFFVARLRRRETAIAPGTLAVEWGDPAGALADPVPLPSPAEGLGQRFGLVAADGANLHSWFTGRRLWLSSVPVAAIAPLPRPETWGLAIASPTRHGWKPTTAFLQRWGPYLSRNRIDFTTAAQAQTFLQGAAQPLQAAVDPGFVHGVYGPFHLGCGSYRDGLLRSHIPKAFWSTRL